jgi:N-acetylmuramoyl-L-alanine amidase
LLLFASVAAAGTTVENIRIWSENNKTRIVLDLSNPVEHNIFTLRGPDRLVIDLKNSRLASALSQMPRGAGSVRSIRSAIRANGQLRVVLDLNTSVRSRTFTAGPNASYGDRLVIDLQQTGSLAPVKRASEGYRPGRDIVIAIDAGHGGHDPGAIGPRRTREKDVALQISRELAKRINGEPGMKAVLVRDRDIYIDHRERMAIARGNKADLFVSIHADAVDDRRANGASVYALSLKGASDEAARQLARRENASVGGVSLDDKDDVLASVLFDLSQSAALSASLDVGNQVARQMGRVTKMHRNTVQQAGFLVPRRRSCSTRVTRHGCRTRSSPGSASISIRMPLRIRASRWISSASRRTRFVMSSQEAIRFRRLPNATTSAPPIFAAPTSWRMTGFVLARRSVFRFLREGSDPA